MGNESFVDFLLQTSAFVRVFSVCRVSISFAACGARSSQRFLIPPLRRIDTARLALIRFPLDDFTVLPLPSALTVSVIRFYLSHLAPDGAGFVLLRQSRYFRVRTFPTLVHTQGKSGTDDGSFAQKLSNRGIRTILSRHSSSTARFSFFSFLFFLHAARTSPLSLSSSSRLKRPVAKIGVADRTRR